MQNKRAFIILFSFAALIGFSLQKAWAQTATTGDLSGVVTDPTGAIVPNITVTLRDLRQGNTRDTKTNDAGIYRFSLLQAGDYEVDIDAPGFQPIGSKTTVSLGQVTSLDVKLALKSTSEKVVVVEEAPLVQTENGNFSSTLDERTIQTMPNQGNDMTYPLEMTAGVTENTLAGYGNYAVNGISATGNLFTINGMDDNDPYLSLGNTGATSLMLGQMEVQEATIVANGYGGEFNSLAGSNVNYITKSGSNQFHGSAAYYWNGKAFNATSFFDNFRGVPKSFVNANQYGAEVGGPIVKDKVFWYFHTEGLRLIIPTAPQTELVPSPQFEAATLANLETLHPASVPFYNTIFSFYNGAAAAHGATPGDGAGGTGCGTFAATALNGADCTYNFTSSGKIPTNEQLYSVRIDYNMGTNDKLFGRYQMDRGYQGTFTDPINPLFNLVSNQPEYQGQISENHTFGPSTTNQFIISGQWYAASFYNPNQAATLAAFPTSLLFLSGFSNLAIADFDENGRNVTQAQISDDVTKVMGRHTLKFGVKYRRNDVTDQIYTAGDSGLMIIPDLTSFYNGGMVGSGPTATDQTSFEQNFPSSGEQRFKFWTFGGYAEDDFQVKSNLTLTVSFRADHPSNPTCKSLCFARLNEPFTSLAANPALDSANTPYNELISTGNRTALVGLTNIEWAPRFGFAWQPFGRARNTVIRGGIGIFWNTFPGQVVDNISENPPLFQNFTVTGGLISPAEANSLNSIAFESNKQFVTGFAQGLSASQISALDPQFVPPSINYTTPFTNVPQYQKWSLEFEQGLGKNTSVTVSYNGNHGIHEPVQNAGLNAWSATPFGDLPTVVPDPEFGYVNGIFSQGISNYNGGSVSFIHRYATGQISANYTYSHALDDVSNGGFSPFASQLFLSTNTSPIFQEDPYNLRRSMYGSSDYDVRHYFSLQYLWELPIKRFVTFGHGPDALLKGWNVAGTVLLRSGLPFTVIDTAKTSALDITNYGPAASQSSLGPFVFASLNGAAAPGSCTSVGNVNTPCLNSAAFVPPGTETGFAYGMRNAFRGPEYWNTDFSIWKALHVIPHHESAELDLGFQFYNIFNHPNFDNPYADLASSNGTTFGTFIRTLSPATTVYGVGLGADASPRLIQLKAQFKF